ncbi:nuclear transport factor 2 family protein [Nocardioides solisilvae]|uniref:nuclear transport factor 2 family protein n=1 Tax=Nocardioides solisilvae TaxID=1542435 RepID=UPI0019501D47|nr:nuclear transport factor 2 family protein [Nocardioides solisilvae]
MHTDETFDKDGWVRVNAEYPDFERMHVEDLVASGDRAVARCRVTATTDGEPVEFAVATFVTARDERIVDRTEVWTDVGLTAPEGTRPDPA